ncbi:transcriptional regulator, TraR/DksA family [Variovorax sp. OK605]|uniref:TraR/DksA family transcriptional regulator n=1 Tax=Variovorax sp. OK605 TaxID=1855317 RepID=UPI0008EED1C2|nr:TraR/DksA family transcriptional regulator [Variovorax sp. OK605]SFQ60007.1 transcriptional regulator, TraR/DksA family [Variovorax sp. OK605]
MSHLTATDCIALGQRLDLMKQQTLDELRREDPVHAAITERDGREVADHADEAEAERADDVRFAEFDIDRERLADIERAQQRMAEGRYGTCAACGDAIARERLQAQPTAARCSACQEAAEKALRHGTPR